MFHQFLNYLANRNRRDADAGHEDSISPVLVSCAIRPGGPEWGFFVHALMILDETGATAVPLLPAFLTLVERSSNGMIVAWNTLPLKNRAPSGFSGYRFVIRELIHMLRQTYECPHFVPNVRSEILRVLELARNVRDGRELAVYKYGHLNEQSRLTHWYVVRLWTEAIEQLEKVRKCEGTADMFIKYRNDKDDGGSGSGTQRIKDGINSKSIEQLITKAGAQLGQCKKEYRGSGHNNYYATSKILDVGTRVTAVTGAAAVGGIGVGVVLNSMAAAAGATKAATFATAFAATSTGKAIAIGTMVFGAPAVVMPCGLIAGLLLRWAFRD